MIKIEHFANSVAREHAWSEHVKLNGEPFRYEVASESPNSVRYPKAGVELNLLIDALAPTDDVPTAIDYLLPQAKASAVTPDFRIHFGEKVVFCECTAAGDPQSFTWQLTLGDWQHRLSQAIYTHPEVADHLLGRYLAFIPSRVPSTTDIAELVKESLDFISHEDLSKLSAQPFGSKVPTEYPKLHRLDTTVATAHSERPYAFVQKM